MKALYIFVCLLLSPFLPVSGQVEWLKTYDLEHIRAEQLVVVRDTVFVGGFYLAGGSTRTIFLQNIDLRTGDLRSVAECPAGAGCGETQDILELAANTNGQLFAGGNSIYQSGFYVSEITPKGNSIDYGWVRTDLRIDYIEDMAATDDGIIGVARSGLTDYVVFKLNFAGEPQWEQRITVELATSSNNFAVLDDGGAAVLHFNRYTELPQHLKRYDAEGTLLFDKLITRVARAMGSGPNGTLILTEAPDLSAPDPVIQLVKYDETGTRTVLNENMPVIGGTILLVDPEGMIYILGKDQRQDTDNTAITIVKYGPSGTFINETVVPLPGIRGSLYRATLSPNGGILLLGSTTTEGVNPHTQSIVGLVDGSAITTATHETGAGVTLSAWPNPTAGMATIALPGTETTLTHYRIVDMTGRVVKSGNQRGGTLHVDLSPYQSGMYVLQLQQGNATRTVRLVRGPGF